MFPHPRTVPGSAVPPPSVASPPPAVVFNQGQHMHFQPQNPQAGYDMASAMPHIPQQYPQQHRFAQIQQQQQQTQHQHQQYQHQQQQQRQQYEQLPQGPQVQRVPVQSGYGGPYNGISGRPAQPVYNPGYTACQTVVQGMPVMVPGAVSPGQGAAHGQFAGVYYQQMPNGQFLRMRYPASQVPVTPGTPVSQDVPERLASQGVFSPGRQHQHLYDQQHYQQRQQLRQELPVRQHTPQHMEPGAVQHLVPQRQLYLPDPHTIPLQQRLFMGSPTPWPQQPFGHNGMCVGMAESGGPLVVPAVRDEAVYAAYVEGERRKEQARAETEAWVLAEAANAPGGWKAAPQGKGKGKRPRPESGDNSQHPRKSRVSPASSSSATVSASPDVPAAAATTLAPAVDAAPAPATIPAPAPVAGRDDPGTASPPMSEEEMMLLLVLAPAAAPSPQSQQPQAAVSGTPEANQAVDAAPQEEPQAAAEPQQEPQKPAAVPTELKGLPIRIRRQEQQQQQGSVPAADGAAGEQGDVPATDGVAGDQGVPAAPWEPAPLGSFGLFGGEPLNSPFDPAGFSPEFDGSLFEWPRQGLDGLDDFFPRSSVVE